MVAGAPVKHAPVAVRVELISRGVWQETLSDGTVVVVSDLTSALWTRQDSAVLPSLSRPGRARYPRP